MSDIVYATAGSKVRVIDSNTLAPIRTIGTGNLMSSTSRVAPNADGSKLFIVTSDSIWALDTATNIITAVLGGFTFSPYLLRSCLFSADGETLCILTQVKIVPYDVSANSLGSPVTVIVSGSLYLYDFCLSVDGTKLYCSCADENIYVLDATDFSTIGTIDLSSVVIGTGHLQGIRASGSKIYVVEWDGAVHIIDATTDTYDSTISLSTNPTALVISPDNSFLITAGDGISKVDISSGTETDCLVNGELTYAQVSNPQQLLLSQDGGIILYRRGLDLMARNTSSGLPLASGYNVYSFYPDAVSLGGFALFSPPNASSLQPSNLVLAGFL